MPRFGYRPNGTGTDSSPEIDYGYYDGLENALTMAAIERKVAEIEDHSDKTLLIPDHFADLCKLNFPAERHEISILLESPYRAKAAHSESIDEPICNLILKRYRIEEQPEGKNLGYALWVAKRDAALE